MIHLFANVCAWTGEKDLALEQLAIATQIPGGVSYGQLKLHPFWDPLRGDPRFEKLVASLAPSSSIVAAPLCRALKRVDTAIPRPRDRGNSSPAIFCNAAETFGKEWETVCVSGLTRTKTTTTKVTST
jgi:hypothetical protein